MREITHGQKLHWNRHQLRTAIGFGICLSALLALCACSTSKNVNKKMEELRVHWQTNYLHQANLPERVIDWSAAVKMMLENNLKLKESRTQVTNAQEMVKQVWKDLIPSLYLRGGISKRLANLHNTSVDDVNLSADSFFNLPGLVNFGARLYSSKLFQLRSEIAYRLAEREEMVALYQLFFGAEEAALQISRLETERATAKAMEQVDTFTGQVLTTELRTRELTTFRDLKNLQDSASTLLGNRDYKWIFSTNNLPELRYHEFPLDLGNTNRIAQMQLMLFAVELEAARAQVFGLKLRYWPELNIFVSSPALYARESGRSRWWDADEMRASADVFWNIDTRGQTARIIRQTKRQIELQKQRQMQETLRLINQLIFTQGLIATVQEQLDRVDKQIELLLAIPPAQNYVAVHKYVLDYRSLAQQQIQLKRELTSLNTLLWFVDEDAWRHQVTAAPTPLVLN